MFFNLLNQPELHNRQGQERPPNLHALITALLNPMNARQGDVVFSQEAFDRVMTQLMDQNQSSGAPGPASDAAINSLPTKPVVKEMMGSDGKAECSICMENVEIGDEVTVLPCTHWFHGQCVTAWLKEHDTCPHCRKPITPSDNATPPPNTRRRSSRRSSSVASPISQAPESSRRHPYPIPETPSELREARQQYYGSRRDQVDYERSRNHRHSSHSESRSNRHDSRNGGTDNGGRGDGSGGGGGGGVWERIRSHLPFQG